MNINMNKAEKTLREPERDIPVAGSYDVIVCGGGPAGIAASISAARTGSRTLLIETDGFLGGVWTAGLLSLVLDAGGPGKGELMEELQQRLARMGGFHPRCHEHKGFTYDAEIMKTVLEQMCLEAGVHVRLYTFVAGVIAGDSLIRAVITESASGREAFTASMFVDCTGNGALSALAGCSYEIGHPETGKLQPASLIAVVSGVPSSVDTENPEGAAPVGELLQLNGIKTSYQHPGFYGLPQAGSCSFAFNHEYGVSCDSAEDWTKASIQARSELFEVVAQIRRLPGWSALQVAGTASRIGIREGKRIVGLYRVTVDDLKAGRAFADGICTVYFPVDIHALDKKTDSGYSDSGVRMQPYQIPLRSLIAKDFTNLGIAGRCASGDFFAHASYRVTGNSVPMGEAAGMAAAEAVRLGISLHEVDGAAISRRMLRTGERA